MVTNNVVKLAMKQGFAGKTAKFTQKASNCAKYLEGNAPEFTKTINTDSFRESCQNSMARRILSKTNWALEKGFKLNELEIPADTFLKELPSTERKAVAGLLGNPDTFICSAKANTNGSGFSILGFIGKKGNKTVGKGAVSVSEFGTPNAVAKWRYNGKNLQTNGFVDCAKEATADEISIIPSFMSKMFGIKAQAGKAANITAQANAKKVVDILPEGEINILDNPQNKFVNIMNILKHTIG